MAQRRAGASFCADRRREFLSLELKDLLPRIHSRTIIMIHRFAFPTTIHFGAGARALVAEHLKAQGVKRPLIVTDRGIAPLPMLNGFIAGSPGARRRRSIPRSGAIPSAARSTRASPRTRRIAPTPVIGLGGGAALDVAKAVALMAVHPGEVLEYAWDHPQVRAIERELPYFIALPTTAGTGSEVGRSSVISDDATHIKKIIFSPALLAKAVFADPELTLDLPAHITAATGMDALTHNVESYLSPAYHPLCDGIAPRRARASPRDRCGRRCASRTTSRPRSDMMMSSMMGAIAFQKDLGAVHSCAHALSTVADLHHGLANGIMIDHVMRFNMPSAIAKMAELAHVVGAAVPGAPARGERRGLHRLAGDAQGRSGDTGDAVRVYAQAAGHRGRHRRAGRGGDQ